MLRKFSKILTFVFLFAFIGQFLVFSVFYLTSDELLEEVCEVELDETLDDIFTARDHFVYFWRFVETEAKTIKKNSNVVFFESESIYKQIEKTIPVPPPEFHIL